MVPKPRYDEETDTLFLPLIKLPDTTMMEVTVVYWLIKFGYSMEEIRTLRNIPSDWTAQAVNDFIARNGEAEYEEQHHELPLKGRKNKSA